MLQGVAVRRVIWASVLGLVSAGTSWAVVPKEPAASLDQKEFFRPDLYISTANVAVQDTLTQLPNRAAWRYSKLEPFGLIVLILLILPPLNILGKILNPLVDVSDALIRAIVL